MDEGINKIIIIFFYNICLHSFFSAFFSSDWPLSILSFNIFISEKYWVSFLVIGKCLVVEQKINISTSV